ncbi:hypothetical protein GCM10009119_29510 [Algoriphagus jejuensis]|uniref:TonB C-terminal domain-containing protein n=1 Tax=Algoriphagus jejuensis TaxID=419934 RepID=A0ABP3YIC9_9BACT
MKDNVLKNSKMACSMALALCLGLGSCQITSEPELEGPTQVEAKPSIGPSNVLARVNDVGKDGKEIFDVTEVQPNPPGGMEGWSQYLGSNLSYPNQARQMGIEGTVIVLFLINSDGSVSNVEVLRGIGGGCDEEAVRVVENSPKWVPAQQKGQVVNSRMRLPVRFKLGA